MAVSFSAILVLLSLFLSIISCGLTKSNIDQWTHLKGPAVHTSADFENIALEGEYHLDNQPAQRSKGTSQVWNGTILLFLGVGGGVFFTNSVWQYHIELNLWRRIKEATSFLDVGVADAQFLEANNIGNRGECPVSWIFDETQIIFIGGRNNFGGSFYTDEKWLFSLEKIQWARLDDFSLDYDGNYALEKMGGRGQSGSAMIENEYVIILSGYGRYETFGLQYLDDIWLVDLTTFDLTLIRNEGVGSFPVYGQTGVYDILNTPGGRYSFPTVHLPESNELYTVGGRVLVTVGYANHVWSLNISSWEWRFISGDKSGTFYPNYDPLNEYDENVIPGGRCSHNSVLLNNGGNYEILMFGGLGFDSAAVPLGMGRLNDIFLFDINKRMWKFRSRDAAKNADSYSNYGNTGVYHSENFIGVIESFQMHLVKNGTEVLILMGYGFMDFVHWAVGDVWRLELNPRCHGMFADDVGVCSFRGKCVDYNCQCDDGYYGDDCTVSKCFGVFSNSSSCDICSGLGVCVDGSCLCWINSAYNLEDCSFDQERKDYDDGAEQRERDLKAQADLFILIVSFTFGGIIGVVLVLVVLIVFTCFLCSLCKRVKKYKGLDDIEDIDLILEEHKMDHLSSNVKIKIKKELFEIKHSELTYLRVIGQGGSDTTVFLVKYRDHYYAFKKFRAGIIEENNVFEEFEKEVSLLSSLRHPNIIGFYGACVVPPLQVGILLQYCKFGDAQRYLLSCKMEGKELTLGDRMRLLGEIASAMSYLHSSGILHRDLKLENVLISDTKTAKVMDFGLSKFSQGEKTQTKKVGTSFYIAPEVLKGKYSNKIDVYSFAIVVYLIITGKSSPYDSRDGTKMMYRAAKDPTFRPKIERKLFRGVEFLIDFVERNWSHNPEKRDDFQAIVKVFEKKIGLFKGRGVKKGNVKSNASLPKGDKASLRRIEELERELNNTENQSKTTLEKLRRIFEKNNKTIAQHEETLRKNRIPKQSMRKKIMKPPNPKSKAKQNVTSRISKKTKDFLSRKTPSKVGRQQQPRRRASDVAQLRKSKNPNEFIPKRKTLSQIKRGSQTKPKGKPWGSKQGPKY